MCYACLYEGGSQLDFIMSVYVCGCGTGPAYMCVFMLGLLCVKKYEDEEA